MKKIRQLNLNAKQVLSCEQQNAIVAGFITDITTWEEYCQCKYGESHKFYAKYSYKRDSDEEKAFREAESTYMHSTNLITKLLAYAEMESLTPPESYVNEYEIFHGWTEYKDKNGNHLGWIKGAGDYSNVPDGLAGNKY